MSTPPARSRPSRPPPRSPTPATLYRKEGPPRSSGRASIVASAVPIAARAQHVARPSTTPLPHSTSPFESGVTVRAAAPSKGWKGKANMGHSPAHVDAPPRAVAVRVHIASVHYRPRRSRAGSAPARRARGSRALPETSCTSLHVSVAATPTPTNSIHHTAQHGPRRLQLRRLIPPHRPGRRSEKKSLTGTGARAHARRFAGSMARRRTRPHFRDGDGPPHAPFARPGLGLEEGVRRRWGHRSRGGLRAAGTVRARRKEGGRRWKEGAGATRPSGAPPHPERCVRTTNRVRKAHHHHRGTRRTSRLARRRKGGGGFRIRHGAVSRIRLH